jgi:hypothetical protein
LEQELPKRLVPALQVGDVFIQGGSPGHAILVVDMVQSANGTKLMLLAQSYMPSQEFHVLLGFTNLSPWYPVPLAELETPEWRFPAGSLRHF